MNFRTRTSHDRDEPPEKTDDHTQDRDPKGLLGRVRASLASAFAHPAAGKTDPNVTDIGSVTPKIVTTLRAAGYGTARDVFEADRPALVEAIDDTAYAGYLQHMAERTLTISDAPFPRSRSRFTREDDERSETVKTPTHDREKTESADRGANDPQPSGSVGEAENATEARTVDESHPGEPATVPTHSTLSLTDVEQVGEDRARVLRKAGYASVEDVTRADESGLTEVEGIGGTRAETITASATALLAPQTDDERADTGQEKP